MSGLDGWTAPGFEAVRDAFVDNFESDREIGAGFAAYHRGEKVADLWGGLADADSGTPWTESTLVPVFSTTKGMTAVCANRLIQEGRLDPDAAVADYWPKFAAGGKESVTVGHLLSHQAGLAWVDGAMTLSDALAWDPVIEALEQQTPHWEPGTDHGYHATTYGWLVGEVIRRVDGRSVGTYLREEIADPLSLDCWIGLPEDQQDRVATLAGMLADGVDMDSLAEPGDDPVLSAMAQILGPETELGRALFAPGGAFSEPGAWNSREVHAAEVPAANGICDARSLARLYAACVSDVDGMRLLTPDQVAAAVTQRTEGPNRVLMGLDVQFGLGFMVTSSMIPLGGPRSFGHFGAGGSVGWADPDAELGFGYVMNKMDMGLAGDVRSSNLVNACYAAIS
jgi:CubicO group peptidase (beta-lactamase class C family)